MNFWWFVKLLYDRVLLCRWISYEEADGLAEDFGRGLKVLNPEREKPVCMFADTR
jgi:hypothetical protein